MFFRQKALTVTNNKGVEPAMEWLLAHADEVDVAPECVSADSSTNTNEQTLSNNDNGASSSSSSDPMPEVKSFKCEEWFVFDIFNSIQKVTSNKIHIILL